MTIFIPDWIIISATIAGLVWFAAVLNSAPKPKYRDNDDNQWG